MIFLFPLPCTPLSKYYRVSPLSEALLSVQAPLPDRLPVDATESKRADEQKRGEEKGEDEIGLFIGLVGWLLCS